MGLVLSPVVALAKETILRRTATACVFFLGALGVLAGCGGKQKGGGAKSAAAAQMQKSMQKTGGAASSMQSSASNQGNSKDGVSCDAALDGVGFCATDSAIVFCSAGSWWLLDCAEVREDAYCGQSDGTIDCF